MSDPLLIGTFHGLNFRLRMERDHIVVDSAHLRQAVSMLSKTQIPSFGEVSTPTLHLGSNIALAEVVPTTPADTDAGIVFWAPRIDRFGKRRVVGSTEQPWLTRWVIGKPKLPTPHVTLILLAPRDDRRSIVVIGAYYGEKTAREINDPRATEDDRRFWLDDKGHGHAYVFGVDMSARLSDAEVMKK